MPVRFPTYAPFVLLIAIVVAGCEATRDNPTAPDGGAGSKTLLTAEPLNAQPEFVIGSSCHERPPYNLHLTVVVGGEDDLILRRLRFHFVEPSGTRLFPEVIPIPTPGSAPVIPTPASPGLPGQAALPGASIIPIPGSAPLQGMFVQGGRRQRLPYDLRFGCGAGSVGTLFVVGDGSDRTGRPRSSELRVRVG